METESFREQRRRRRQQQAFRNFLDYARSANVPDPEAAAERAATEIHGEEASEGREERQRAWARAATEQTVRQHQEEKEAAEQAAREAAAAAPARPAATCTRAGAGRVRRSALMRSNRARAPGSCTWRSARRSGFSPRCGGADPRSDVECRPK